MGTRCGNVDPDVVTYLQEKEGLSAKEMSQILNKKSGFIGLSGVSSDARDLNDSANEGNARAKLTLKKLTYDITKFIGAYAAAMAVSKQMWDITRIANVYLFVGICYSGV